MADALDGQEYKTIKAECERKINLLEAKPADTTVPEDNIEELLDKAAYNLVNLDVRFESADTQGKRSIIGSIFPEKLCFSDTGFQIVKVNEAAEMIFRQGKAFEENNIHHVSGLSLPEGNDEFISPLTKNFTDSLKRLDI